MISDDLTLKFKKTNLKKEEIVIQNVDIRQFYIDNQALTGIEEAVDCIYRQWISYEKFKTFKNNPIYKNTEFVKPTQYKNDYKTFVTQEETTKK